MKNKHLSNIIIYSLLPGLMNSSKKNNGIPFSKGMQSTAGGQLFSCVYRICTLLGRIFFVVYVFIIKLADNDFHYDNMLMQYTDRFLAV